MMQHTSLYLAIISIVLIILIILLIYYKISLDNNDNIKNSSIETFAEPEEKYSLDNIKNSMSIYNNEIIKKIAELKSVKPDIILNIDNNEGIIDNEYQNKISQMINVSTDNIIDNNKLNYNSNDIKITKLENMLKDLENMVSNTTLKNINNKHYGRIKSLNNGMEMNLFNTKNSFYIDPVSGSNTAAYLVNVNNGCLSVGANDYDIYQCNDKSVKQYFKLEHILNETQYQNNIDNIIPFDNVDKSKINYPFSMIKSVNNENCLTNNHGTLTVQPCAAFTAQRWMAL
jgi:hypothetical protein